MQGKLPGACGFENDLQFANVTKSGAWTWMAIPLFLKSKICTCNHDLSKNVDKNFLYKVQSFFKPSCTENDALLEAT